MHVLIHCDLVGLPFKILFDKLSREKFLPLSRYNNIFELVIKLYLIVIEDVLRDDSVVVFDLSAIFLENIVSVIFNTHNMFPNLLEPLQVHWLTRFIRHVDVNLRVI
jgi:hypothetical protein